MKMEFLNENCEDKCESIFEFACNLEDKGYDLNYNLTDTQSHILNLLHKNHNGQKSGKYNSIYEAYVSSRC